MQVNWFYTKLQHTTYKVARGNHSLRLEFMTLTSYINTVSFQTSRTVFLLEFYASMIKFKEGGILCEFLRVRLFSAPLAKASGQQIACCHDVCCTHLILTHKKTSDLLTHTEAQRPMWAHQASSSSKP